MDLVEFTALIGLAERHNVNYQPLFLGSPELDEVLVQGVRVRKDYCWDRQEAKIGGNYQERRAKGVSNINASYYTVNLGGKNTPGNPLRFSTTKVDKITPKFKLAGVIIYLLVI